MSPASLLRLFPYDYESLSRPLAIAERRIAVIRGEFDDPWAFDEQAREVAMIELEKIWDEMESLGLVFTGELINDSVFPYLAQG